MYEDDEAAGLYDLIYRGRKDYRAEADQIAAVVRARVPQAASLLDVACGTGAHLRVFGDIFGRAEGVELSPAMIGIAGRRVPSGSLHQGDMRDFDLGRTFDAVVCLFSSIGYMRAEADLNAAVANMARHVAPGGVLVIEPFWFPDTFIEGYVSGHVITEDGTTVARVSHSTREGDFTRMDLQYLVADAKAGIRHRTDIDHLRLFTREQYEKAFTEAGQAVDYLDESPVGSGLFVGSVPGA